MHFHALEKTLLRLFTLQLCLWAGLRCSPSTSSESGSAAALQKLTLTGSSTVAPLAAEIGKRFEHLHPGRRVDVQTGGSSRGIADTMSGLADIGMVSRALEPTESETLLSHTIAFDGIGIVVHADNTLPSLTDRQVRDIFTGKIQTWSALGGPDREIVVVNKAEGRATLEVFLEHFGLESRAIQADVVIGDNEQGIKTVAGNPSAIGYVSIGAAEFQQKQGVPIRLLPSNGVEATTENLALGRFPMSRPLNLVTKGEPQGVAEEFIAYCRSVDVHDLIRDLYFVPVPASAHD